jgi:hypothetical protein
VFIAAIPLFTFTDLGVHDGPIYVFTDRRLSHSVARPAEPALS